MKLDVKFTESGQSFNPQFEEVHNISDGGYERGYTAGYEAGFAANDSGGVLMSVIAGTIAEFVNENATSIRVSCFEGVSSLERVEIPNVTEIGASAFRQCVNLKEVVLGSPAELPSYVFLNDKSIISVVIKGNTVPEMVYANAFQGSSVAAGNGYIYVPDNLVDSYKTAANWSSYAAQIKPLSELEDA